MDLTPITLPGSGLQANLIPGAVGGEAAPTGQFAAGIPNQGVATHLGVIPFQPGEVMLHYVRMTTVPEFKFMGQGDAKWGTWEWTESSKQYHDLGLDVGNEAFIYDHEGNPHVLGPGSGTSQGYREVDQNDQLILSDTTYASLNGISQHEDIGDGILIGQGTAEGGLRLWDGSQLRTIDASFSVQFHNWIRLGDAIAITYSRADGVVILQTHVSTLKTLPIYTPPASKKPDDPPPPPPPPPKGPTTVNPGDSEQNPKIVGPYTDPNLDAAVRASWAGTHPGEVESDGDRNYWKGLASHPAQFSDGVWRLGWNRYWEDRMSPTNTGSADPHDGDKPAVYQPGASHSPVDPNGPQAPSHPVDFGPLMAAVKAVQDQIFDLNNKVDAQNLLIMADVNAAKQQLQRGFTGKVRIFGQATTLDITPKE